MYNLPYLKDILSRLNEPRRFIQVVLGPRQVGKTMLIQQTVGLINTPSHYALADEPMIRDRVWIEQQWQTARLKVKERGKAILILDEVQKIEGWSETVKYLWDMDSASHLELLVVILGSSPLLIQKGLTESLAGRFEVMSISHWSFSEMRDAFGLGMDEFIYFGGYPGAAALIKDEERWRGYIVNALIETTISKDILLMKRVDKPALLKRLFYLGCNYSGQILSYQKMIGQLQDVGNTTTLAHYLELLSAGGMLCGLNKYCGQEVRRHASSPKLQIYNTALMSALSDTTFEKARGDHERWGRLVESSVGAHLLNSHIDVYYWRERGAEVDFVVKHKGKLIAIEVKSGRRRDALSGMAAFAKLFKPDRLLLIGGDGIPLDKFLGGAAEDFFDAG
ncbi:MAG: ATP-binding protein [Deltaproteobacteria bacterium]|nr:ATP-binding protein [Deltaproteobacteria bacterium]